MNDEQTTLDRIRSLDDQTALRVLATVTRARDHTGNLETELTPEARAALAASFGAGEATAALAAGDLARAALLLLAEDPRTREGIDALVRGPATRSFDAGATLLLTSAVLIALQTHVRFERDKNGKVSLLVEKRPTSDALLKDLAQKLLGWWKKGGQ